MIIQWDKGFINVTPTAPHSFLGGCNEPRWALHSDAALLSRAAVLLNLAVSTEAPPGLFFLLPAAQYVGWPGIESVLEVQSLNHWTTKSQYLVFTQAIFTRCFSFSSFSPTFYWIWCKYLKQSDFTGKSRFLAASENSEDLATLGAAFVC